MAAKIECTPFEEALEKTGNGKYNVLLVLACGLTLLAMGVDLYGFGLAVSAACDLNITVSQKGVLTSLPFIGILLVSYIWGYVSDTRGRRFTLVLSMQAAFVLSCISSMATNWLLLGLFKFLSVCFSCSANSIAYTLAGESCVQRVRSKYMLMMSCMLILSPGIGALLTYPTLLLKFEKAIPLLGINFTPWRLLIIVHAIPLGIGGIAIRFFHESPKFLANWGKNDEALQVLQSMYAINNPGSKEKLQISSVFLEDAMSTKSKSLLQAVFAQSAPLFRPPILWRTIQLYFIVAVVYFTNNSLLIWLPYVMNLTRASLRHNTTTSGDICTLISSTNAMGSGDSNPLRGAQTLKLIKNLIFQTSDICLGYVEDNVIMTFAVAHFVYAFLAFIISYLMRWRRIVLIWILSISAAGGALLGVMPEPVSSVFMFMVFTCTNLGMGILAAYFLDLYPTSCRGMVACLSIMIGRTSAFIGINLVGNYIFSSCHTTFYIWSLIVFSSVVAAWFLPPDKSVRR